ncbi:MAG: putative phosphodiesterase [Desulforhopalus sp.]|jgi:predicted phosphodiesterase
MKLAVISDIHGNAFALKAVLADIKKRGADTIVNLGDIFYGPIAPKATYDILMDYEIVTICGNQDRQLYESSAEEVAGNPTMAYVLDELQGEPMEWLYSLSGELQLDDDIYLCHGAPGNDLTYLLEDIHGGLPIVRSNDEILPLLKGQTSSVILCGHTHLPRSIFLDSGQLIVNPGSVGLPAYSDDVPVPHAMENYSSQASYALVEKTDQGWLVDHVSVPYDVELACRQCEMLQRNDWVGFLKTGRAG